MFLVPGAAPAQALDGDDFDTFIEMSVNRCLDPMEAGEAADLAGLRPVTNVERTVFTDNAGTSDDRVVLDQHVIRGLRWCEVATNEIAAQFSGDDGFEQVAEVLDGLAVQLLERGYVEEGPCEISGFVLSGARMLENGDYLRRFSGQTDTRAELRLNIDLSAARYTGDVGMRVEEHYGPPMRGCT
ncbi:hypothetical protein [Gymnodinialimonas hymeniacidonis]|uniref:hypothetical protein n=1 Tax=Gymnodinialimonas hymeniacidonis TaxID=3126508 RepID=UPI0034C5F1C7